MPAKFESDMDNITVPHSLCIGGSNIPRMVQTHDLKIIKNQKQLVRSVERLTRFQPAIK